MTEIYRARRLLMTWILRLFLGILIILPKWSIAGTTHWQTLTTGLEYARINPSLNPFHGVIHAFRVDLNYIDLNLGFATEQNLPLMTIQQIVKLNNALFGINGGFFNTQFKPLGLRVKNGITKYPIKPISWWGIFYIMNGKPYIVSQSEYATNKMIKLAIQSGPRLIINGRIPNLRPGLDDRSAIGITRNGRIIILATDSFPLSTKQLAETMLKPESEGGLNCINAINLDGGSSTQLFAQIKDFYLSLPGYSPVSDAILAFAKNK